MLAFPPVAAMNHALEKKESHKNVTDSTSVGHALVLTCMEEGM